MSPDTRLNIRLLQAFNLCLDFRIYSAIAVLYYQQITGSFALALAVFSIVNVTSALSEVPTGVLSDRVGRKLTLVIGQCASVLSILGYAIGGSFSVLAAGAALEGFSRALFSGNNEALLYDSLRQDGHEMSYPIHQGRVSSMFQIGLGLSALVASIATLTLHWVTYGMLFWLSVIPQIVGLALSLLMREPRTHGLAVSTDLFAHLSEAIAGFRRNKKLRLLNLASILGFAIGESKFQFLPAFFAMLWPIWALPIARLGSHALAALGFLSGGRFVRRWGESRVLLGANAASIATGLVSVSTATVVSPALYPVASYAFGPSEVAQGSLMQKAFSDRQRATMGSLNSLAGSIAFAAVIYLLGLWADRVGPRYALLTAEILSISVLYLYWRLFGLEQSQIGQADLEDQTSQG